MLTLTATAAPLTVETEITEEDYYRFALLLNQEDWTARLKKWLGYPALVGASGFSAAPLLPLPGVLAVMALAAVALPLAWTGYLRAMSRALARAPGGSGRSRVTISPEGVHEVSAEGEISLAWTRFQRIAAGPEQLLFYYEPTSALLIPRRSFPQATAADQFYQAAHHWHRAALSEIGNA